MYWSIDESKLVSAVWPYNCSLLVYDYCIESHQRYCRSDDGSASISSSVFLPESLLQDTPVAAGTL